MKLLPTCCLALVLLAPCAHSAVPLAVLGDSDSAGYQDRISFPEGSERRGGRFRQYSLQWTEILARLRPDSVDLGPRELVGMAPWQARLWRFLRGPARAPRKLDHRHNFAISGALCADLVQGHAAQAPALRALIASEPERWKRGVVLIRMGINDLGTRDAMGPVARGDTEASSQRIADCHRAIASSMDQLRQAQPSLRFILVGLFDNAHWAPNLDRWHDPAVLARLDAVAEAFDAGLRDMARHPEVVFFSDRIWFESLWGSRDAAGQPAYREVELGPWRVGNTHGDSPQHASLGDGHAGTIWNALWANALIDTLNRLEGVTPIPRLDENEILDLLPDAPPPAAPH
ncbi:SGNH/GDSL hydrolase family protein [Pseudomarimonas salicorniae]|uniref:GDSL-like Lipase/Acylhydrolase family protein n=1 Tax=Pseudomarimonas salicorniae TaxID=2933270 RepID=A0ABT0GL07_9GAMM|nr:SGNH/GDSL hydrolase family protein [Lysobacter sp. CAU 1642]MCK7595224.1 hypothetical protein [Lysobacter sp. CAU 1642]